MRASHGTKPVDHPRPWFVELKWPRTVKEIPIRVRVRVRVLDLEIKELFRMSRGLLVPCTVLFFDLAKGYTTEEARTEALRVQGRE